MESQHFCTIVCYCTQICAIIVHYCVQSCDTMLSCTIMYHCVCIYCYSRDTLISWESQSKVKNKHRGNKTFRIYLILYHWRWIKIDPKRLITCLLFPWCFFFSLYTVIFVFILHNGPRHNINTFCVANVLIASLINKLLKHRHISCYQW